MNKTGFFLISGLLLLCFAQAQPPVTENASQIQLDINKLNVLGSVLYIAAHPDDENTAVMAYMSKGKLVRTGYLALTRGDGGQNLLGPEKGDLLGVLRTQELLAARRIDGAEQFFTRAIDFGYSKTPEETMRFWDKDKILSDVVWVIRKFRPDIILTRFSSTQGGHGHHLASAILAKEAFYAAADSNKFPEQLKYVKPWQAKRILWNTWRPDLENRPDDAPPVIQLDLGTYNPLLGKSYTEIAAISRSMHKSQGFGSSARRGSYVNYFEHTAGDAAQNSLFDGVDLTWGRIENSDEIQAIVHKAISSFDPENPAKSIPVLVNLYKILDEHAPGYWIDKKKSEVQALIRHCAGLWLEADAEEYAVVPGDSLVINMEVINRNGPQMALKKITLSEDRISYKTSKILELNNPFEYKMAVKIPDSAEITQPFWLKEPSEYGSFNIADQQLIGRADSKPALSAIFNIAIEGKIFTFNIPVKYRWNDPTKGESYRPLVIQPAISIRISQPVYVFESSKSKPVDIRVENHANQFQGRLKLELPSGWQCQPENYEITFKPGETIKNVTFQLTPSKMQSRETVTAVVESGARKYDKTIHIIDYDHIPVQTVFEEARAEVIRLNIKTEGERIGYIMGSGDEIPQALEQIGYKVDLLSDKDIESGDLSKYDAIVCGVRAFNTRKALQFLQARIIDYVKKGGVWIVQHNTRFGYRPDKIGPYNFKIGRDRIADETVKLSFIDPSHPLLNIPNKISQKDFDGWVQERGLYFADDWDGVFQPILEGRDKGESVKRGALLYAEYGKGVFIYSGLSFFRQLPAGVPGAYRLFVNMIAAGKTD